MSSTNNENNHDQPDDGSGRGSGGNTRLYRGGWSTSICDLFSNPLRKENCCALVCCGILLSDRNAHLILNETRPNWTDRFSLNIGLPVFVFLMFNILYITFADADNEVENAYWDIGAFWAIVLVITILLCRAKSERIKVREAIMKRLFEKRFAGNDDNNGNNNSTVETYIQTHRADTQAAHRTCSCFPKDLIVHPSLMIGESHQGELPTEGNTGLIMENPPKEDLCSCLFSCFSNLFCGFMCHCWFQCCGMCAIGQEAREIETLLDDKKKTLQMDYITFQPYAEYYPNILQLRQLKEGNIIKHWKAISKLSYNLVKILLITSIILTILALTRFHPTFRIENLLIVMLTFAQAFIVLYLVHWENHKFDISVDAIIKYFASGFCLCTFLSFMYEVIISLIVGLVSQVVIAVAISEKIDPYTTQEEIDTLSREWVAQNIPVDIIFLFINSFIIAGFIEEMSKYFAYYMVETPDLMDPRDLILDEKLNDLQTSSSDNDNEDNDGSNETNTINNNSFTSRGASITVAMVAVAAGFACSENLIYIFIYTEPDWANEIGTLIARSLFPVHALCAAIQSIGVVNRDVLKDEKFQLGRIIFPAVLLHGAFDFSLMVIDLMYKVNEQPKGAEYDDYYDDTGIEEYDKYDTLALIVSVGVVIFGVLYYFCLAHQQRNLLQAVDDAAVGNSKGAEGNDADNNENGDSNPVNTATVARVDLV